MPSVEDCHSVVPVPSQTHLNGMSGVQNAQMPMLLEPAERPCTKISIPYARAPVAKAQLELKQPQHDLMQIEGQQSRELN